MVSIEQFTGCVRPILCRDTLYEHNLLSSSTPLSSLSIYVPIGKWHWGKRGRRGCGRRSWALGGSEFVCPSLVGSWVGGFTFISRCGTVGALFLTSRWAHVALPAIKCGAMDLSWKLSMLDVPSCSARRCGAAYDAWPSTDGCLSVCQSVVLGMCVQIDGTRQAEVEAGWVSLEPQREI